MAFVVSTAKTIRTHWKKSLAGFGVTLYAVKYGYDKHQDNLLRRKLCAVAKEYGDAKIQLGYKPRRVTVFLNPAASQGKGRKLFEKTAAPILYLAGMEVNVIATEYDGQVKNFMSVLETQDTDAIVVAGGDGLLLEAVTGFLRKEDTGFVDRIPVGVIPLGKSNRFSKTIFGHDLDQVRMIAEAAIAVVRAVTKKVDVIKLQPTGDEGKTIYSLCGLEAGAYRDAEERKKKYWYFGPLKHRWTYVRAAMKEWPPSFNAGVTYLEANEDNMTEEEKPQASPSSWSFFRFLTGSWRHNAQASAEQRAAKAEEKKRAEAEQMVTTDVAPVELTITKSCLLNADAPLNALHVTLGPTEPSKVELIREGWARMKQSGFRMGAEGDSSFLVKKILIEPKVEDSWYNIDGEAFEAMPVEVSLLKNKLNFFCPQTES